MAKQDSEVPQIKNYLSVTSFLQDVYLYRKSQSPGFSYDSWATEIGFKSRSFLKMLIDGERAITPQTADTLCDAFSFSIEDRSYFRLLISYCQARGEEEKELYLEKIFENLGQNRDLTEIVQYSEFLSSKELPKLLVLLSFSDLDKSPAGLAAFLKQSVEQMVHNLTKLQELELASVNAMTGQWEPTKKNFKVPKSFSNRALTHYHNESLLEAIEAQKMPTHLRRFRSLLLPLEEEGFEKLLSDIEALISKSVAKYDSEKLEGKRLYKMNINLHPVTEKHPAHKTEHESTEACSQERDQA